MNGNEYNSDDSSVDSGTSKEPWDFLGSSESDSIEDKLHRAYLLGFEAGRDFERLLEEI